MAKKSEDTKLYVDPSSGAAPQPGGLYPGKYEVDEKGNATEKDVALNEVFQPGAEGDLEPASGQPKEEAPAEGAVAKGQANSKEEKPAAKKAAEAPKKEEPKK